MNLKGLAFPPLIPGELPHCLSGPVEQAGPLPFWRRHCNICAWAVSSTADVDSREWASSKRAQSFLLIATIRLRGKGGAKCFREAFDAELVHQVSAVNLDGAGTDPKIISDRLVG